MKKTGLPEALTVVDPVGRWTANQVWANIPSEWRGCEIYCGDSIGRATPIKRVALHQNRSGRKVIVLHAEEVELKS